MAMIMEIYRKAEERFSIPDGANPSPENVITISPASKYERCVGFSKREEPHFQGICEHGVETLIACYHNIWGVDEYFTPDDFWRMCRKCPYRYSELPYNLKYKRDTAYDDETIEKYLTPHLCLTGSAKAYVYFISDSKFVKIGSAINPNQRLKELQTGNPNPLEIMYLLPCKSRADASQAEHKLHLIYSAHKKTGEWFDVLDVFDITIYDKILNVPEERVAVEIAVSSNKVAQAENDIIDHLRSTHDYSDRINSLYSVMLQRGASAATIRRAIERLRNKRVIRRWQEGFGKTKIWFIQLTYVVEP